MCSNQGTGRSIKVCHWQRPKAARLGIGIGVCIIYSLMTLCTQSTDKEMIPARNTMDAHAQDFAANDELLLSILKALEQFTR